MKADITIHLSDTQLREILNGLSIPECKMALKILQGRIEAHQDAQTARRVQMLPRHKLLMEIPIEDLDLKTTTRIRLRRNGIRTLKDITEIGLDGLLRLPRIGEGIVKEIKEVVFHTGG